MENLKEFSIQINEKLFEKLQDHLRFSGLTRSQYIALLILEAESSFQDLPSYHKSLNDKYC